MLRVRVEAQLHATENEEKVRTAITNVFASDNVRREQSGGVRLLVATGTSAKCLLKLHSLLRTERILDAARAYIRRGWEGRHIIFFLNKQAAYMGKASFCEPEGESPMGPLRFEIEASNPDAVIDWLAPKTFRGEPPKEREDISMVEGD